MHMTFKLWLIFLTSCMVGFITLASWLFAFYFIFMSIVGNIRSIFMFGRTVKNKND